MSTNGSMQALLGQKPKRASGRGSEFRQPRRAKIFPGRVDSRSRNLLALFLCFMATVDTGLPLFIHFEVSLG